MIAFAASERERRPAGEVVMDGNNPRLRQKLQGHGESLWYDFV